MPLPTSEPWKVMLDTMTQARLLQNDFLNVVYTRDDIVNAAKNAGIDTYAAITSIFRLLFVILYPVAVFVIQWTYSIARKCYTKWIVQGGIKHACIVVYEWHKQRTQKQLVIEFVCITMALAVYALRRWIQKHKFVQRIQFYIKRKRHTIHKSYRNFVGEIARISKLLAYLFPHMLFFVAALAVKLLFPSLTVWMACESMLPVTISQFYPFLATAWYLMLISDDDNNNDKNNNNNKENGGDQQQQDQQQQQQPQEEGEDRLTITNKLQQWLDYWMVNGSYHLVRSSLISIVVTFFKFHHYYWAIMPSSRMVQLGMEAELAFFVWLLLVPYLSTTMTTTTANNGEAAAAAANATNYNEDDDTTSYYTQTPLYHMARLVGRVSQYLQNQVAALCSEEIWTSYVLAFLQPFVGLAVTLRLISPPFKDKLLHFLTELRTAILPAIMSLAPIIGPKIAIPYARTILPLAKSNAAAVKASSAIGDDKNNNNNNYLPLLRTSCQYWIIQSLVTSLLHQSTLHWWLSWLPFGNLFVFIMWWYMSWPTTINFLYGAVVEEFELLITYTFHHFDKHYTTTAAAAEAETPQQQAETANAADQQQRQVVVEMDNNNNKEEEQEVVTPRLITMAGWLVSRLPSADDLQPRREEDKNDGIDDDIDDHNNGTGPTTSSSAADGNNANNNNRESPGARAAARRRRPRREQQQQQQQQQPQQNDDANGEDGAGDKDDDEQHQQEEDELEERDGHNGDDDDDEYDPMEEGDDEASAEEETAGAAGAASQSPIRRSTRASRRSRNPTPVY